VQLPIPVAIRLDVVRLGALAAPKEVVMIGARLIATHLLSLK
jgi:hypothetical protein